VSSEPKSSADGAEASGSRRPGLSRDAIREVALTRFAQQGYHATTLRQIASDLDVTVAAIYHHYTNKEELLTQVVESSLRADFEAAALIRARGDRPLLDALIRMHVLRHIELHEEALVVHHEAKYLPEPYAHRVRALLREYEATFRDAIVLEYDIPGQRLTMVTKVALGMGAAVIHWFHPDALLTAEEVADRYVLYTRGILDVEARADKGAL
jgi:AcrR family transcriptional regulator